jgi:hypothetical protein
MKKVQKEKKSKKQTSWEELLEAIRSLEEIVTVKEPEDWEDEGEVRERTSESSQRKGKR